jgi:hypothetical protein
MHGSLSFKWPQCQCQPERAPAPGPARPGPADRGRRQPRCAVRRRHAVTVLPVARKLVASGRTEEPSSTFLDSGCHVRRRCRWLRVRGASSACYHGCGGASPVCPLPRLAGAARESVMAHGPQSRRNRCGWEPSRSGPVVTVQATGGIRVAVFFSVSPTRSLRSVA